MSEANPPGTAIILFAHGSRDPAWAAPFHRVRERIQAARRGVRVELAFLELMQPSLTDAVNDLARSCGRIVIAPLFMGAGAHVKRDLGRVMNELRGAHPSIEFEVLPGIGETDAVLEAIGTSILRATERAPTQ